MNSSSTAIITVPIEFKGTLKGHSEWITDISMPSNAVSEDGVYLLASGSRDKTSIIWKVEPEGSAARGGLAGVPHKSYRKHNDIVSNVEFSANGKFLLTASYDKTIRLWDVADGSCYRTFLGHNSDVTGIAISPNNRQIVSCSRDRTIRLWNTKAEEKFRFVNNCHNDTITTIVFSPESDRNIFITAGLDGVVKVWSLDNLCLIYDLKGHNDPVHAVALSPDGSLVATGGVDGKINLWDIIEGQQLYTLEANSAIQSLCFSPTHYWLSAATEKGIKTFHLERRTAISDIRIVGDKKPECNDAEIIEFRRKKNTEPTVIGTVKLKRKPCSNLPWCTTLKWSVDGKYLFAGSNDSDIYVFGLRTAMVN